MGFQVNLEQIQEKNNTNNCSDGSQWIWTVFGQCVVTPMEVTAFYLGLFSIFLWFLVYIPQLYENYKRGRCDDALSIWFLLFWLLGDTCNLVGCLLTHQFPIQTMTAVYYVAMDISIIVQFFYYSYRNNRIVTLEGDIASAAAVVGFYGFSRSLTHQKTTILGDTTQTVGYVIGLLSTVFYLGSRLPQIIMNLKRGKTDGVNPLTFLLAVMANFAYAFSVLMSPRSPDQSYEAFVMEHLPWLTGSLGTVALDFTILLQCLCLKKLAVIDDEEEPLLGNER